MCKLRLKLLLQRFKLLVVLRLHRLDLRSLLQLRLLNLHHHLRLRLLGLRDHLCALRLRVLTRLLCSHLQLFHRCVNAALKRSGGLERLHAVLEQVHHHRDEFGRCLTNRERLLQEATEGLQKLHPVLLLLRLVNLHKAVSGDVDAEVTQRLVADELQRLRDERLVSV